ncbi:hypothetical protein CAPTEDRAFT_229278 [Capitella teleta]|uniref:F5/8 type C domain-containing protein n=1 Tax=Capitella teleta TaxID=283909 RepID=R7USM4_CAPTE|nr:hypothetical protein CAPTEDRAFT_229278 [Capitella teleta]|eukprot:ELU06922.1 hypothetical protein CAPTEDRAFT_229278 [Capitella teleta]
MDRVSASQLEVSTTFSSMTTNMMSQPSSGSGWLAGVADTNKWIQIDFLRIEHVLGVSTWGRGPLCSLDCVVQFVKTYKISHSIDASNWETIHKDSQIEEFTGNFDRNTEVFNPFSETFDARYVRLHPLTWNNYPTLRWDFHLCNTAQPYVVTNKRRFDATITITSALTPLSLCDGDPMTCVHIRRDEFSFWLGVQSIGVVKSDQSFDVVLYGQFQCDSEQLMVTVATDIGNQCSGQYRMCSVLGGEPCRASCLIQDASDISLMLTPAFVDEAFICEVVLEFA